MYDAADSILAQKLAQMPGVGQVVVGGGALPGVRVELNPNTLNHYHIGLEQVRTVLRNANVNRPKGEFAGDNHSWGISTTDQLLKADQYKPLIVIYQNGAPVQLANLGDVVDSVEDIRNVGLVDGKQAINVIIFRQPGANIIQTVDNIIAALPELRATISPAISLSVVLDRTTTIRASVNDVELTLLISIALVILVVFAFLRDWRATLIPGIVVPISLIGTFGVMYLLGYSLDNLSLMALTISTGFVVDDAIVVIENIARYRDQGMPGLSGRDQGCGGNWLYGIFDQRLLDCSVHPDSLDGWHCRPAVSRIRRYPVHRYHGLDGHLFDDYADDVCQASANARRWYSRPSLSGR